MSRLRRTDLHCRRCGSDLDRGVEQCRACQYNPRESGFRLGALVLLAAVVFFSISIVIGNYYPYVAAYTMAGAFIGFFVTAAVVLFSFVVKPYHFVTLFS